MSVVTKLSKMTRPIRSRRADLGRFRKVSTPFRSILKVVGSGSLAKLYKISRQLGSLSIVARQPTKFLRMSRRLFRSLHDLLPLGSLPIVARLPTKFLRMSRRLFRSLRDLLPLGRFSKVTKQLGRL